ncbi:unnamed protein product [Closterium sp. Naga37s-1]|nr:unnamed protein product [Closterium sp. Naga37s-1]
MRSPLEVVHYGHHGFPLEASAAGAMPDGRMLQQRHYNAAAAAGATTTAWRPLASFTQVLQSVSPAYQLRRRPAGSMIHTHHQEHVMTNDNPEAGSSGTTSHVNHVHGNSLDGNLRPEMEWDGEQQQQQQPISASMLMLQHYQNPGGLPTGWRDYFSSVISQQQHFFSSISQRQQHPVSLHDPRSSSSNHPGHPVPRPSGELFRPAVYSGAATSARESTRVMGAPSTLGAAIPVEATQDVSARAVAAHGEVLGESISAPERHQQQPTAGYPASASPAIAFPAMLQPRGPAASSAAASYMRPHGQMGSAVGGVGGAASDSAASARAAGQHSTGQDGSDARQWSSLLPYRSTVVASALDASALDASVLVASALDASVLVASVLDASALDASALDASALVASALDASVLVASALVASVLDASALDASALGASALDASALDASALDASALDASALDASVLDAAQVCVSQQVATPAALECLPTQ